MLRINVRTVSLGVLSMLAGCAEPNWVPGPGNAGYSLGVDQGRCRLVARGMASSFEFGASGSQKFVATAAAGALLAGAIGGAIENETNYRNCMMAQNWLIGEPRPSTSPIARSPTSVSTVTSVMSPAPIATNAMMPPSNPPVTTARLELLVRGSELTPATAQALHLDSTRGVVLLDVVYGGAGSRGGLQVGDTILAFNGAQIGGLEDLQRELGQVSGGAHVTAAVWRDNREVPVRLRF
jgi:S1-C subfamily serine protease